MQVAEWMTENPYCVTPEDRLDEVAAVMRDRGFRHAPVVDRDGRLLGMLSERDLREHKGALQATRVSAAMSEPPVAVGPEEPIEQAARTMLKRQIGALPVVGADGRVVGIVTSSDLLRGFVDGSAAGEHTTRIDFRFTTPTQRFADAVKAVEGAGGTVLGLGTFKATADGSDSRRFYIRLTAPRIEPVIDALARHDIIITAVHHLPVTPATAARS